MKRKLLFLGLMAAILVLSLAAGALADDSNTKLMGTFTNKIGKSLECNNQQYIPLEDVADTINRDLDWRLSSGKVVGRFNHIPFECENFMIYHGKLYVPLDLFKMSFNLIIEIHGNNYYIYSFHHQQPRHLEVTLQTDSDTYYRRDPIAVSLVVYNDRNRRVEVSYSSGQEFDLVLKRYGREFWRYSDGKGFITLVSKKTFDPHEFVLYTELINPGENKFLPRGNYELIAEITLRGGKLYSEPVDIRIR